MFDTPAGRDAGHQIFVSAATVPREGRHHAHGARYPDDEKYHAADSEHSGVGAAQGSGSGERIMTSSNRWNQYGLESDPTKLPRFFRLPS
jgi:hypothetical protein